MKNRRFSETQEVTSVGEDAARKEPVSTVGGNEAAAGTVENRVGSSRGKAGPPCGPAVPLLGAYRGFPGGPVVKTPRLQRRGCGFDPWSVTS